MRILKILWASPGTVIGLILAGICRISGGSIAIQDGVIEAQGGAMRVLLRRLVPIRGGCSAITLGHVIIGRDQLCLDRFRIHEHVHVRQYEMWGPFMIPAYLAASFLLLLQSKDPYRENPFEIEAREAAGEF